MRIYVLCLVTGIIKHKEFEKASGSEIQNGNVAHTLEAESINMKNIVDHARYENGVADKDSGGKGR